MSKNNYHVDSVISFRSLVFLSKLLAFTVAYYATGKLGMFLAVPPGYATAIYPPSGIALAGILLLGNRAWVSVLLGSFCMNLSIAANDALINSYQPIFIAFIIAFAATLQAVVGADLVRRFADFPNPLANEKSVFKFMLYGGVLSTLINSTISVSTLVLMQQVPRANFFTNWTTWWMGDAIGVFIFAPLTLIWLYRENAYFQNRKIPITLTILTAFLLTILLVVYESHKEAEHLKVEFDRDSNALNVALEKSITEHLAILYSLESFYSSSDDVNRNEFKTFVREMLKDSKGIEAVEWCPIVLASQREKFEKSVQKENFPEFKIKEINVNQHLIRASHRDYYVPVTFVEPFRDNEIALGYDLNSSLIRRQAFENARDTGEIATTARITFVQNNQAGVLSFVPIYKNNLPHQSLEERQHNILGYVLAVFHIDDILNIALKHTNAERLHFQLFDENSPTEEQHLLFSSNPNFSKAFVLNEKGLFGNNVALLSSSLISMGNRQWRFQIAPTQEYFAFHHSDNAWLILLTGLVLTSIAGVFVLVSTGRELVLQQLVEERTTELVKIQKELELSNAELKQLANTDSLTGLFNRRVFLARLEEEVERISRFGGFATLFMLDLDFFKQINDNYGHAVGDEVLKQFSQTLKNHFRSMDIAARLGGEEFAILLPATNQEDALIMAERLHKQIAKIAIEHPKGTVHITASIGAALLSTDNANGETVLSHADSALYAAKTSGRNQTCWFYAQKI